MLFTRRVVLAALSIASLASCDGTAPPVTLVNPPPLGDHVLRAFGPEFEVAGGEEVFVCYTVPLENTEELYVTGSHGYQAPGGHHTLILSVDADEATIDEPHPCTGSDMAYRSLRFLGAGTAFGSGIVLPDGVALVLPVGRRLLIQTHYVNTDPTPRRVQDAVDLTLADRADVVHIAGAYTEVDQSLDIPPRSELTRELNCAPPMEMTVPWMFAHMHEWGVHATIELVRGGETTTIYDADWDPALRDSFPVVHFDPPLVLTPSDRLITRCTWRNDEEGSIAFPTEMCATFMPFYPSDGALWVCDETGTNYTLGG